MARTNRKAALTAQPPASVDALDTLNLDDMFNEGDGFFDGLDIDLDGMGELPNSANKKKSEAKTSKDLDAIKMGQLGTSATAPEPTTTRRKTKRKIRPPHPPDEDDDDYYEAPKKKRRASKASAKKTKGSKAAGKASAKSKVSTTMPPPMSRGGTMDPKTMAAIATQKKGTHGQQLVRQTSASSAASVAASTLSRASSTGSQPEGTWTQPETIYCGLRPSSTEFYPFVSLPMETSLGKTHRNAVFTSISASISTTAVTSGAAPSGTNDTDGLYRLLLADLDQMFNDRNTSQAANELRRANLGHAIATARMNVSQADRNELMANLHSVCYLLKRQYDFLNQNLSNMERWCRDNFSPQDYQVAFGHSASAKRGSQSSSSSVAAAIPHRAGTMLSSLRSPIVKIKVRCSGFKPPTKGPLVAHIRLPRGPPPPSRSDSAARTTLTKKRKHSSVTDIDRSSISGSSLQEVVVKELSYIEMKPFQRRHHVADAVAQRAQSLELQMRESREKHRRYIERQRAEQQKVVDDDEIVSLNTMTMWKWLEKSPHFADYSEAELRRVLECIWEPELADTNLQTKPAEASILQPKEASKSPGARPGDSVFLRLQSLLVDEGSDEEDEEEQDDAWMFGGSQPEDSEAVPFKDYPILDLSGFSLDERALIHLRAAGLIEDISSLAMQSPRSKGPSAVKKVPNGGSGNARIPMRVESGEADESDIDAVVLSMQADLENQRRVNNSRLGFLETAARSHLESMKLLKKREDENASMIARYNQLLKKQKEAKKNARQKPSKNDSDWVPW